MGLRNSSTGIRSGIASLACIALISMFSSILGSIQGRVAAQPAAASRTMLVTVYDRAERPTVDVGPDDFVVEEGNDEREVLSVQVADYPVTLLLDNGVEDAGTLAALRTAATRFIERIGERPIALATLANPPVFVASFENSRAEVIAALDRITAAPPASLRPLAALTQAAAQIRALQAPFSVVVVLSMGAVDPLEQPDADRVTPILDSGAVIHVIALRPAGLALDSGTPDLYKVLTDQTRGQFIPIYTTVSFPIALQRLADQLSTEMMVDYLVPPGSSGTDARVGIRVPGARVRGLGVSK